ncbi:NifB/NifX family molybdenum-iron cluster-binding protein [Propionivibrio sp.]|uniref:NifB/NifX family molybdenum-iron cluster-binding protein n=1 Tax=Propionivibrio sp. TaxID=2212460 RepID=UPI003BEFEC4F
MKLCIPSSEANGLESTFEPHFPQAKYFVIFDTESRLHTLIPVHEDSGQENTPIDAVLCGSINRMTLRNLIDRGIDVYGTTATGVTEAIAQFERGELEAVAVARGQGCGGHQHKADDKGCGGHGHENPDHECCGGGGHGHDKAEHECCHGEGHEHGGCGGQGHRHQGGCASQA